MFTDSPNRCSTPRPPTAATPSSSRSSPTSKHSALAHLPSGCFAANAAWLACAAIAYNLTRAAGALASAFHAKARTATLRAQLIDVAGPDRPLRAAGSRCTCPATGPGKPAWTNCSAAPCTTPYPPPPDHRARTGPTGEQWKSRADRRLPHVHTQTRVPHNSAVLEFLLG